MKTSMKFLILFIILLQSAFSAASTTENEQRCTATPYSQKACTKGSRSSVTEGRINACKIQMQSRACDQLYCDRVDLRPFLFNCETDINKYSATPNIIDFFNNVGNETSEIFVGCSRAIVELFVDGAIGIKDLAVLGGKGLANLAIATQNNINNTRLAAQKKVTRLMTQMFLDSPEKACEKDPAIRHELIENTFGKKSSDPIRDEWAITGKWNFRNDPSYTCKNLVQLHKEIQQIVLEANRRITSPTVDPIDVINKQLVENNQSIMKEISKYLGEDIAPRLMCLKPRERASLMCYSLLNIVGGAKLIANLPAGVAKIAGSGKNIMNSLGKAVNTAKTTTVTQAAKATANAAKTSATAAAAAVANTATKASVAAKDSAAAIKAAVTNVANKVTNAAKDSTADDVANASKETSITSGNTQSISQSSEASNSSAAATQSTPTLSTRSASNSDSQSFTLREPSVDNTYKSSQEISDKVENLKKSGDPKVRELADQYFSSASKDTNGSYRLSDKDLNDLENDIKTLADRPSPQSSSSPTSSTDAQDLKNTLDSIKKEQAEQRKLLTQSKSDEDIPQEATKTHFLRGGTNTPLTKTKEEALNISKKDKSTPKPSSIDESEDIQLKDYSNREKTAEERLRDVNAEKSTELADEADDTLGINNPSTNSKSGLSAEQIRMSKEQNLREAERKGIVAPEGEIADWSKFNSTSTTQTSKSIKYDKDTEDFIKKHNSDTTTTEQREEFYKLTQKSSDTNISTSTMRINYLKEGNDIAGKPAMTAINNYAQEVLFKVLDKHSKASKHSDYKAARADLAKDANQAEIYNEWLQTMQKDPSVAKILEKLRTKIPDVKIEDLFSFGYTEGRTISSTGRQSRTFPNSDVASKLATQVNKADGTTGPVSFSKVKPLLKQSAADTYEQANTLVNELKRLGTKNNPLLRDLGKGVYAPNEKVFALVRRYLNNNKQESIYNIQTALEHFHGIDPGDARIIAETAIDTYTRANDLVPEILKLKGRSSIPTDLLKEGALSVDVKHANAINVDLVLTHLINKQGKVNPDTFLSEIAKVADMNTARIAHTQKYAKDAAKAVKTDGQLAVRTSGDDLTAAMNASEKDAKALTEAIFDSELKAQQTFIQSATRVEGNNNPEKAMYLRMMSDAFPNSSRVVTVGKIKGTDPYELIAMSEDILKNHDILRSHELMSKLSKQNIDFRVGLHLNSRGYFQQVIVCKPTPCPDYLVNRSQKVLQDAVQAYTQKHQDKLNGLILHTGPPIK